jgi:hypothetical protein
VVETWNGVGTFHHKSNVRSVDILYIHNLMSQIVPHCQKHGRNILNYRRKWGDWCPLMDLPEKDKEEENE